MNYLLLASFLKIIGHFIVAKYISVSTTTTTTTTTTRIVDAATAATNTKTTMTYKEKIAKKASSQDSIGIQFDLRNSYFETTMIL